MAQNRSLENRLKNFRHQFQKDSNLFDKFLLKNSLVNFDIVGIGHDWLKKSFKLIVIKKKYQKMTLDL